MTPDSMKLVPQTYVLLLAACLAASPAAVAAGSTNTAETAKPAPKISDLFADEVVAQGKDVKVLTIVRKAKDPALLDQALAAVPQILRQQLQG